MDAMTSRWNSLGHELHVQNIATEAAQCASVPSGEAMVLMLVLKYAPPPGPIRRSFVLSGAGEGPLEQFMRTTNWRDRAGLLPGR